jgi:hypothetical protein
MGRIPLWYYSCLWFFFWEYYFRFINVFGAILSHKTPLVYDLLFDTNHLYLSLILWSVRTTISRSFGNFKLISGMLLATIYLDVRFHKLS